MPQLESLCPATEDPPCRDEDPTCRNEDLMQPNTEINIFRKYSDFQVSDSRTLNQVCGPCRQGPVWRQRPHGHDAGPARHSSRYQGQMPGELCPKATDTWRRRGTGPKQTPR